MLAQAVRSVPVLTLHPEPVSHQSHADKPYAFPQVFVRDNLVNS